MGNYIRTKNYEQITRKEFIQSERILICLGNKVIDATEFISLHPGGINCLNKKNKQDITIDYNFHSKHAKNLIKSMIVYELR